MGAQATVCRVDFPRADCRTWPKLARTLANSLLAMLALAGLLICVRRASGALVDPLPAPVRVAVGGLLALAGIAVRAALPTANLRGSRTALYLNWALPSVVLFLWAAGLSLQGASASGLVGLCGLLLAEEGWSWGRLRKNVAAPTESSSMAIHPNLTVLESARSPIRTAVLGESAEELDAISQQVMRRRQSDGSEAIEGWVRAEFSPGQRHAAAHLAICPPLDRVPECFAEQMDGPAAHIKIAQVLPYGVRFEIKLDKPAEQASSVIVEFSIHDRAAAE
ncbi:MAG: hypothetical protein HY288_10380 [Planctomycetia bacterium]|nr:hypothetical protein [Planctomycetia bacterium]